ncbi:DUF4179 domain-containing protein [Bacillus sp. SM2101]|uniref:DUF4179 domain-containing protein n=1 Tax=Bacillus sp. SM2101 TaxID=2805366 RepID=UPI001BDE02F1|nr:DUF4179 domain-containing protein [Bacillus sp. SM2101]
MSSQWPDIKKAMDKIPVPMDKLDTITVNTIKENPSKKNSKKKKALYMFSAAVITFGLFIGSASISPTMAKIASQVPIIGNFFNEFNDEGLRIAGEKGLTQVINQSSKDNGVTLTINELFYDGTRLTLGYTQESLFTFGELERPTIEVNGKDINFSTGSSGQFITPQKYQGYIEIQPTEELPEEFEIKLKFDAVGIVPGKWEFKFPVQQSSQVKVFKPQEVKIIEQAEVKLSSLKLGPAGTDLSVQVTTDQQNKKLDPYMLNFFVLDDEGNVLDNVKGSGFGDEKNGKEEAHLNYLYSPIHERTKKVRIIPYTTPSTDGTVSMLIENQSLPFVLDQGDFGTVLITDITYLADKIIVRFDVQSDVFGNNLSKNPISIWMEDADGNNLFMEEKPWAEKIEGNSFRQEFVNNEKEGLLIATYKPIMYEGFEIKIQ